jgi:hypothetical protein
MPVRYGSRLGSKTILIDLAVLFEDYGVRHNLDYPSVPAHRNPLGDQCRDYVEYVNTRLDEARGGHLSALLGILIETTGDGRAWALCYDPNRPGRPVACWEGEV